MKTPLREYQQDLKIRGFMSDPQQANAINILNSLFKRILDSQSFFSRIFSRKGAQGVYLWGPVGTGKTYVMDTFYNCLPEKIKKRMHFHEFMRWVHGELKKYQGETDPLLTVAKMFTEKTKVICFDEFIVEDIADAMLLGRLFRALINLNVFIVATSNTKIENLYKEGLQRQNFLPTIQLLQQELTEVEVNNDRDYRRRDLEHVQVYFTPDDDEAARQLQALFVSYSEGQELRGNQLIISGRKLHTIHCAKSVVWFSFSELCGGQRSADDYLFLIKRFSTIFLSDIPELTDKNRDAVRRFINFIDICYDKQIRLIISAARDPDHLYQGERLKDMFKRTRSRLQEMQTKEYLEKTKG